MSPAILGAALCLRSAFARAPLPSAWEADITDGAPPPAVIFLLDLSAAMDEDCDGMRCIDRVKQDLGELIARDGRTRFGLVGTSGDPSDHGHRSIAPVGASREELLAALDALDTDGSEVRNFAEALASLAHDALVLDGATEQPVCGACQSTTVITVMAGLPRHDDQPLARATPAWDVTCDDAGLMLSLSDTRCLYDNVVAWATDQDYGAGLSGAQKLSVFTFAMGIPLDEDLSASMLAWSAALAQSPTGYAAYGVSPEHVRWGLASLLELVHLRRDVVSAPVLEFDVDRMIHASFELGATPLGKGQLRAWPVQTSASDADHWGRPRFDAARADAGPLWDAGLLLAGRTVGGAERNGGDRDGLGRRDIYTWVPELLASSALASSAASSGRMPFDKRLVDAVAGLPSLLSHLLPPGTGDVEDPADLDVDGDVDAADLQLLVDFVRGVSTRRHRFTGWTRGTWRLGDAPRARPAVVRVDTGRFTSDPSHHAFQRRLRAAGAPDLVLMAANDGMLHAFDLDTGRELWAWVPASLLLWRQAAPWAAHLLDLTVHGRVPLFEGTPAVEDLWVDEDGDGRRECDASRCEWRRIVVVGQGRGGPATLALDITDPRAPRFLWEHVPSDATSMGYTLAGPQLALVEDRAGDTLRERWLAAWPSGAPTPDAMGLDVAVEPSLRLRDVLDGDLHSASMAWQAAATTLDEGGARAPLGGEDQDGDGHAEQAHIAGAPAMVDLDSDGDVDVAYTVVHDDLTRSARLYKLMLRGEDPLASGWCELALIEGEQGVDELAYSPTVAWSRDGGLTVSFGTGSPLTPRAGRAALFSFEDEQPWSCQAATPLCGEDGGFDLPAGFGLTDAPLVWGGVLHAPVWSAEDEGCGEGEGRILMLRWDTCEPAGPDDPLGVPQAWTATAAHPSALRVSAQGAVVYALRPGEAGVSSTVGTLAAPGVQSLARPLGLK